MPIRGVWSGEHEGSEQYVKRVVLPSGKTIEVVYFKDADRPARADVVRSCAAAALVEQDQDLHVCVDCDSELVYPVEWDEARRDAWRVTLRCPECETFRDGVFAQDTVDAFDEELDAGTER